MTSTAQSPTQPPVIRFERIDSTSAYARREAAAGRLCRHPMVFVSRRQVSGVGRFGRRWESPLGGLWMTLVWPLEPDELGDVLDGLGLRIGVGCREVVERLLREAGGEGAQAEVRLKWPNDVMVNGKKVLGVLTELVSHEQTPWALVGVGLNANLSITDLPAPVDVSAGTLRDIIRRDVELDHARVWMTDALVSALSAKGLADSTLAAARTHLFGINRPSRVSLPDGSRVEGVLVGLNDDGAAEFDIAGQRVAMPSGAIISFDPPTSPAVPVAKRS